MQHQIATQTAPAAAPGRLAEDIASALGVLRRGWHFIAISVVISVTLAAFYVSGAKTSYQATARLLVLQQGGRILPGAGGDPFQARSEDSLSTHLMIIRSPIIVEQALAAAGMKALPVDSVVDRLTVTVPDPTAKVLQVGFKAGTSDEASKVINGVLTSYESFLKNNYQKNTGDTIKLFTRARDELSRDLLRMEREYLEYRQKNPSYNGDESGRSYVSRRLDQWDAASNQAMVRALHLQSQLELGRKLIGEGSEPAAVAAALNKMGSLGGDAASAAAAPPQGNAPAAGPYHEQLEVALEEVAFQRLTAARILDHLRASQSAAPAAVDEEVAEVFEAEPATAQLRSDLARATAKYNQIRRLTRSPNDPSVASALNRMKDLEKALKSLWERRRPKIAALLSTPRGGEAVRAAEAELELLTAKEAALAEGVARVKADRLQKLRREREQIAGKLGPQDPKVAQLDRQVAQLEGAPDPSAGDKGEARANNLIGSLEQSLEAVEVMRARIQQRFEADLAEAKKAEIGMIAETNLRNNLERQRALFNSVVDQLKQAQLVSDFGSVSAQTINPPAIKEIRPQRALIFVAALLVGVGLGGGMAFVADQLDARFRSLSEMRRALDLRVLGVIPQLNGDRPDAPSALGLVCHEMPRSYVSESFKSVRTNLEYLRRSQNTKVILVTSPQSGDGKSTTASNLAVSFAQAGRKVLLVDADMRRPTQHRIHEVGRERGLPHTLKDVLPLRMAVQPSRVENLDILSAGPEVSNPAELLASHHLAQAVDEMRQAYDVVIIDSPPLLAVADPSILAETVDGIMLVVRMTNTSRPDMERTLELLKTLGTPVVGTVINGITADQMGYRYGGYRYGYRYGYGNSYGYGYGYGYGGHPKEVTEDKAEPGARPEITNGTSKH